MAPRTPPSEPPRPAPALGGVVDPRALALVEQGGGEAAAEVELGGRARRERHRPAGVEDDRDARVGPILEQLDEVPVGLGEELPVERAQLVALGVGAVVGIFDARPETT